MSHAGECDLIFLRDKVQPIEGYDRSNSRNQNTVSDQHTWELINSCFSASCSPYPRCIVLHTRSTVWKPRNTRRHTASLSSMFPNHWVLRHRLILFEKPVFAHSNMTSPFKLHPNHCSLTQIWRVYSSYTRITVSAPKLTSLSTSYILHPPATIYRPSKKPHMGGIRWWILNLRPPNTAAARDNSCPNYNNNLQ